MPPSRPPASDFPRHFDRASKTEVLKLATEFPVDSLRLPFTHIPPIPKHFDFIAGLGKFSFLQAAVIGLTKAARTADAALGTGKLADHGGFHPSQSGRRSLHRRKLRCFLRR